MLRVIASQYLAVLILGFANSATIQSVIAIERPVMYRERAAGGAVREQNRIQPFSPLQAFETAAAV